jgi:hypothetical protein
MSANAGATGAAQNPAAAEPPKKEEPKKAADPKTEKEMEPVMMALVSISAILSGLFYLVFSYGAAKLSYDRFQNMGWAVLNFLFPMFYYPYHALFLSGAQQYGGRKGGLLARLLKF